jgi:hypothetical protein
MGKGFCMENSLEFSTVTLPPHREYLRLLQEARDQYDPLEKLLSLDRELLKFELKYNLSSSEFYQRFQAGEVGDAMDFMRWAGRYEMYLRLKEMISASLDIVISQTPPVYA